VYVELIFNQETEANLQAHFSAAWSGEFTVSTGCIGAKLGEWIMAFSVKSLREIIHS
jgi:hypothetical protein